MDKLRKNGLLIKLIIFLLGLAFLLHFVSGFIEPKGEEMYNPVAVKQKRQAIAAERTDSIDVFFIGDSMAYSSFMPIRIWKEKGYTSYVGAIMAERLCDTCAILRTTLETQSPKVVVLETNCLYRYAGLEQDVEDAAGSLAGKLFPVLKYHARWKNIFSRGGFDEEVAAEQRAKGFRRRTGQVPYTGGDYMKETDAVREVPYTARKYLEEILTLCDSKGATLVFVSVPSPKNWNYKKHNGAKQYAEEHNIPFLDLNLMTDELGIDWKTDTKDGGDHLNENGAKKVSDYLGSYLKETYSLPDRRNDSLYADWEK